MFEEFLNNNKEQNTNIAAEKRQVGYSEDQTIMAGAVDPGDDQTYINIQEKKSDLIRWQQELEPDMFELLMSFQSLTKDDNGDNIKILDEQGNPIPPLCNRLFIYQVVVPKLRPFISKNLINSNFDTNGILQMQKNTADDITDMMADNWDKYGIDFVNFNGIIRDIKNVIGASVWRAFKGWTKKTDSSMIKRIESEKFGNEKEAEKTFKLFGS